MPDTDVLSAEFNDLPLTQIPDDLQGLLAYWQHLRGDYLAPPWAAFNLMEIPPYHLPQTMVKDVENNPRVFRYRFYGSKITELNQADLTGKTTDHIALPCLAAAVRVSLEEFIQAKRPMFYRAVFRSKFNHEAAQNLLRLPLSNDGHEITGTVSIILNHLDSDKYRDLVDGGTTLKKTRA